MPDLKSLDNLYLVLVFLYPGLIVLFVRSQFVTGRRPPHAAALLSYLSVSIIYWHIPRRSAPKRSTDAHLCSRLRQAISCREMISS